MERRDFLRLAAGAGLLCTGLHGRNGLALSNGADPLGAGEYTGPFFVGFEAQGGWDTTMVCDPHPNLNRSYAEAATVGAISFADVGNNRAFFEKFADRLLVINGLDIQTNNHQIGRQNTWTGKLDAGLPNVAALVAGAHAPHLPLAFIAEGTTNQTAGVVAPTRVDDADVLNELSHPNRVVPSSLEDLRTYHQEPTTEMIADWRARRADAARKEQKLPRIQAALDNILTVRGGANELELLQSYLPDPLSDDATRRKIEISVAAYKAGLAVSATFQQGSFDTHSNNDAAQIGQLNALLGHVDYLWEECVRHGIQDQVIISIGSDFARSPGYNGGNGKDHWEIGSMMLMGTGIEGNRVVGATDDGQFARMVDPETLALSEDGQRITPGDVHHALRRHLDVPLELDERFALGGSDFVGLLG